LLEGQTPTIEKSLTLRGGTRRLTFSKRGAEFKATIDMKKVHQGHVSGYVNNVDLIYLRQKYNYEEYEGKND
jgi:hypothetical protein